MRVGRIHKNRRQYVCAIYGGADVADYRLIENARTDPRVELSQQVKHRAGNLRPRPVVQAFFAGAVSPIPLMN